MIFLYKTREKMVENGKLRPFSFAISGIVPFDYTKNVHYCCNGHYIITVRRWITCALGFFDSVQILEQIP